MKLYNKKQHEIVKIASKDKTKPALQGLYIDGDTTVMTDGRKLMTVKSNPMPTEEWPANSIPWKIDPDPFIISREQVEKSLKNIPRKPDFPILGNVAIGKVVNDTGLKELACQTTNLENTDKVEGREIDAKYPNYKQIIPPYKDEELYQAIGISATYLKEVCTLLEKYKERSRMITLHVRKKYIPYNEKDKKTVADFPIVLTADDGEGTEAMAVIMPMVL